MYATMYARARLLHATMGLVLYSAHNLPCLPIHKRKIRKIPFFFTTIHILFLYVNIGFLISYLLHIFSLPLEFFYVFSSFENSKLNFIELLLFVLLLSFSFRYIDTNPGRLDFYNSCF